MPAPAQPTGFGSEILQAFNIPTSAPTPIQKPPNAGLTFPVFTPPAASSYGTTNPMAIPWTPPDLAGAINAGIKTGAGLATDALTNRKTLQQIQMEEQAQKIAIARANAPGAGYYTSVSTGPSGAEIKVLSPAEIDMQRAELANRAAAAAAERARVEEIYGRTPKSQAEIEKERAETAKTQVQTKVLGASQFDLDTGATSNTGASQNLDANSQNVSQNLDANSAGRTEDGMWYPY